MPNEKMDIVSTKEKDEEGNPLEATIIASSFPRWEERGWKAKPADEQPEQVEHAGDGEPTGEQSTDAVKARAEGAEGADAQPGGQAPAGGEQTPEQSAQPPLPGPKRQA